MSTETSTPTTTELVATAEPPVPPTTEPPVTRGSVVEVAPADPGACYVTSPDGSGNSGDFMPCNAYSYGGEVVWLESTAGPTPPQFQAEQPVSTGELPYTGNSEVLSGLAGLLLGAGVVLVAISRRKRVL